MTFPLFGYVAIASYIPPVVVGLRRWKKLERQMKVFSIFCVLSLLEVVCERVMSANNIPTLRMSDIFQVIEFETIIYLYFLWVPKRELRDILQVIGMLYFLYWLLEFSFIDVPTQFQESIATAANLLLIISSMFIFTIIFRTLDSNLRDHAIFWIGSGVILYCSTTIVLFNYSNSILEMGMFYFNVMWHINWTFAIITNIFYTRSFLCKVF